jgi:hypothetical protein
MWERRKAIVSDSKLPPALRQKLRQIAENRVQQALDALAGPLLLQHSKPPAEPFVLRARDADGDQALYATTSVNDNINLPLGEVIVRPGKRFHLVLGPREVDLMR